MINRHLAEHGAEVGGAFEGLLFVEFLHLLDGAGVKGGVVVLLVEGLLYERAGGGDEGAGRGFGGDVAGGVEGGEFVESCLDFDGRGTVCRGLPVEPFVRGVDRLGLELGYLFAWVGSDAVSWSEVAEFFSFKSLTFQGFWRFDEPRHCGETRWELQGLRGRTRRQWWARTRPELEGPVRSVC